MEDKIEFYQKQSTLTGWRCPVCGGKEKKDTRRDGKLFKRNCGDCGWFYMYSGP